MASNNYLTDKFTSLGGLASVAYGSSTFFNTVADQIKINSKTTSLDHQLPSNVLLDYVGSKQILINIFNSALEDEYNSLSEFTDFIDIHAASLYAFSEKLVDLFLEVVNEKSTYSETMSSLIEFSISRSLSFFKKDEDLEIDSAELSFKIISKSHQFEYLGKDLEKVVSLVINNPKTKVSAAVPDTIVPLKETSIQNKDERGVERNCGTIPPQKYYNNVAFNVENQSIAKSAKQGYVGYPLVSLLGESLLNPDSYENLDLSKISNNSILSEVTTADQEIYNISLSRINLGN